MGQARVTRDVSGYTDREDRRLLEAMAKALASGERERIDQAFEAIWHRHARAVALVCARYVRDDADIVSLTDDVFLRFFQNAPNLELTVSLRAYLAALARHAAIDHARATARRERCLAFEPQYSSDDEERLFVDVAVLPDPDADVGASIRYRELVEDLLTVLEPQAVEIILGHIVEGETFGALGDRLGMKEATVRTVYHRALKSFRKKKGESWL